MVKSPWLQNEDNIPFTEMDDELKSRLYLRIAEFYNQLKQQGKLKGMSAAISQKFSIQGETASKPVKWVKDETIIFDEDGKARWAKGDEPPPDPARDFDKKATKLVMDTMSSEALGILAARSKAQLQTIIIVATYVVQGFVQQMINEGKTIEEIERMEPHKILLEALEKTKKYDELLPIHIEMEAELKILREELDDHMRWQKGLYLVQEMLALKANARLLGARFWNKEQALEFEKMLAPYIKGDLIPKELRNQTGVKPKNG